VVVQVAQHHDAWHWYCSPARGLSEEKSLNGGGGRRAMDSGGQKIGALILVQLKLAG
jgi:hypothetical protein